MKVQCPHCKKILSVPDEYKSRRIKCKGCHQILLAKPLEEQTIIPGSPKPKSTPIVVPVDALRSADSPTPPARPVSGSQSSRSNFLTKLWNHSPVAFRTGFLTTLGVVSALTLCVYVYGRIFLPRPSLKPESTYLAYKTNLANELYDDRFQKLFNEISMPLGTKTDFPYTITDGFIEGNEKYFLSINIVLVVNKSDALKVGQFGQRQLLLSIYEKTKSWLFDNYSKKLRYKLFIRINIPNQPMSISVLNKRHIDSDEAIKISFGEIYY
jgi:endogenous inhibitor of DNA gyrase (YacG/DUF329 family)